MNKNVLGEIGDLKSPRGIFAIFIFSVLWVGGDFLASETFSGIGCAWYPNGGLGFGFTVYFGWQFALVIWLLRIVMAIFLWKIPYGGVELLAYTLVPAVATAILALPLRKAIQFKGRLDSARVAMVFTQLSFVGCIAVAVITQSFNWATGLVADDELLQAMVNWFSGDLIGFTTMAPVAVMWICPLLFGRVTKDSLQRIHLVQVITLLGLYILVVSALFWVFPDRHFNFWHLIIFIYLYSGWNFGLQVTTITVLVVNFSLLFLELLYPSTAAPLEQQVFLTMISGGGLFLALLCDENRRRYEQSANYVNSLDQVAEAQHQFFSTLCHEIRTPLNAISGFSELMADKDQNREELLGKIKQSSKDLLRLVERLVSLGHGEKVATVLEPTHLDLRQWLSERAREWDSRAQEIGLKFCINFSSNTDRFTIIAHPTSAKLAIEELMDNALKFTKQGKIDVAVTRGEGPYGRTVRVSIRDTGIGLGDGEFNVRTFMHQPGFKRAFGGLGVGLSLARSLLEADNGSLSIESPSTDQGTLVIAEFLAAI